MLAPFDDDFRYIEIDYQDTLQKLQYVNEKLNPLRQAADNIDNLSVQDLMADFEIDNDILGLIDSSQSMAERKLSDDD